MNAVRFDVPQCEALLDAMGDVETKLSDSVGSLSPLVTQALALLDMPGQNGLYGPIPGLLGASQGVRDLKRDLDWRVEFVRRMDGSGFNRDGLVEVNGMPDWTWEEAQAWYTASDIEKLWEERNEGSTYDQQRRRDELEALIAEYIGTDDPDALAAVLAGLREGEQLVIAVHRAGVRMQHAAYVEQIGEFARERDISMEEAEELWVELQSQVVDLISQGFSPAEAGEAVYIAEQNGLDIDEVSELADAEGIGLLDALTMTARADHYAMSTSELIAYDGLTEHFAAFDNAKGGSTDDKVSLDDIQYVANNPSQFTNDEVAAALALLASPALLSRLDTGRENNDVLNEGERFGDDDFDDRKISLEDLESFEWKQGVNALVGTHYDDIDIVNGGEHDQHLSKADFEKYLDQHGGDLSPEEIQALEVVIDGELYDKGWLERNKRSLAIAAAVVAGAAIAIGTGGLGSGISGALVTAAVTGTAGAGAAAGTTLTVNAFSDESDWDDDLVANAGHGFLGGMAGGGLGLAGSAMQATTSGLGRFAIRAGVASDGFAVVGMGGLDFAMDVIPGVDHEDLGGVHDFANTVSLVTGVAGLSAAGTQAFRNVRVQSAIDKGVALLPEYVIDDATSFVPHGVPAPRARVWVRDDAIGQKMMQAAMDSQLSSLSVDEIAALTRTDIKALESLVEDRIVSQVATGVEAPVLIEISEPLVKLVPLGDGVSGHSPFWMTEDALADLLASRRDIADALGLPLTSHADDYQIYRIKPVGDAPISVFTSEIAPTSELAGLVETTGGIQQVLVPDRSLFGEATFDIFEPIISRENGGLIAPVREAGTVVHSLVDDTPVSAPLVVDDVSIAPSDYSPPTIEDLVDANS